MSMYNLPKTSIKDVIKNRKFWGVFFIIIVIIILCFSVFVSALRYFPSQTNAFLKYFEITEVNTSKINEQASPNLYKSDISYEQAIIDAAKNVSPSVVSIVISKNLPTYEEKWVNPLGDGSQEGLSPFDLQVPEYVQKGTQYQEVGAGSGFIVSADGIILTNKHVVSDNKADYTVLTNDGQKYPAKVLALDPVQDLAVIKIQLSSKQSGIKFQPVTLGDSSGIEIGQTAIAIGNALGQFSNTVSIGAVSGLGRTISASDQTGGFSETLEGIIQTDAAINAGNSGGPLVNLHGEVIGVNVAMASGAQGIGFALPINIAKKDIDQIIKTNKIVYPFLGVRYILIDDQVKQKYKLSVDYGALVSVGNNGEIAVTSDSPAEKAGIKKGDVILEIDGEKIDKNNSISQIVQNHNIGDKIKLHILRDGKEQDIDVVLGERPAGY